MAALALLVIGYYLVAVARSVSFFSKEGNPDLVVMLGLETVVTLLIFGMVDYPSNDSLIWWAVLMLIVVRAASLHRRLVIYTPRPINRPFPRSET